MKTSAKGRSLIERNEGKELEAYPDPATGGDPWTIGYGDTGLDVVPGLVITDAEASERLSKRLEREFEPAVNRVCEGVPTTQGQFDAMVSLSYNIGTGGFKKSSVARLHAAGDYAGAADAFAKWNKAAGRVLAGLTRRRAEEADLYMSDSAIEEAEPEAAPEAPPIVTLLTDPGSGVGHQKALGGGLAVQCTMLFDKVQALFTGVHIDADTMMLIAGIAVALIVWKISSSHKEKAT